MRRLIPIFLILLVGMSGCQAFGNTTQTSSATQTEAPDQYETIPSDETQVWWSLSITAANVTREEGGIYEGSVVTEGFFEGRVYGITVIFLDENKETLKEIPIGNISRIGEEISFNTTVPTIPVYVVATVERWETGDIEFTGIYGKEITEEHIYPYEITDPENFTQ